jgi:small-conductance mechanosensitive channel
MSTPARRQPNHLSRRQREARAYRLVLATGGVGIAAAVVLVLSIFGITSFGLFVLLAVLTAALGWATKRSVS